MYSSTIKTVQKTLTSLRQSQIGENAGSVPIVLCDIEMQSTSMALNIRDEGYLVTQAKGHLG